MLVCAVPMLTEVQAASNSGTCGTDLSWHVDESTGVLTISGTGDMDYYEHPYFEPWCDYRSIIKSVIVGSGITSLGDMPFSICENLTSITVSGDNKDYSNDEHGVLFNKNKTEIVRYPRGKVETTYKIPDSVTSIGYGAFWVTPALVNVEIPNGVTSLESHSFYECTGLTSVTIPDSVVKIGYYAFSNCIGLTNIEIPGSVKSIGKEAFAECTGLTSLTICDGVESIGESAFGVCTGLTSVTIPNSVTSIGNYVFYMCSDLKSVTISESLTSIASAAFSGTGLTDVTIPDSVTDIGDYAFSDTCLTTVKISEGVVSIGEGAFSSCAGLTRITVSEDNKNYSNDEYGVLFSKDKTELIQFPEKSAIKSYTIPESVKKISFFAFSHSADLQNVTIPENTTEIGAFAFSDCIGLTSITIPDSVYFIDWGAFDGCTGLESITIPNKITSVEMFTFSGCTGMTSVTIPDSVKTIYSSAFDECTALKDVYYAGNEADWDNIQIEDGNECLTNATIHFGQSVSYDMLTYQINNNEVTITGCDRSTIGEMIIPSRIEGYPVTKIGAEAFMNCAGITSVTIPEGVIEIGKSAFATCYALKSVKLPDSLTTIGDTAFYYDQNLSDITLSDNITRIGKLPFQNTAYYNNESNWSDGVLYMNNHIIATDPEVVYGTYEIKPGTKTIADFSMGGCKSLFGVTLPDGMISIGASAFWSSRLIYIHIPSSVTYIGANAFYTTGAYICSDAENCYAKTYANNNGITFKLCNGSGHMEVNKPSKDFSIKAPSQTVINYGDSITLHLEGEVPVGARVVWVADNENFSYIPSADGKSITITPQTSGETTFSVYIFDENFNVINEVCTQTMTAKAGFFQKIIAFFKNLFGLSKIIPQAIRKII